MSCQVLPLVTKNLYGKLLTGNNKPNPKPLQETEAGQWFLRVHQALFAESSLFYQH